MRKIRKFLRENKRMPSYREIADMLGFSSKNASFKLVKKLIEQGFLDKDEKGHLIPKKLHLPALGYIQAGFPSPAEEELVDTLSFDEFLIEKPDSSFILKVSGDSMSGAGINPGDLLIIEKGRDPKEGDIIIAQVDGQWTLKYFQKEKGKICLAAANPKYKKIYPEEELVIGGVVVAVVRKYHR